MDLCRGFIYLFVFIDHPTQVDSGLCFDYIYSFLMKRLQHSQIFFAIKMERNNHYLINGFFLALESGPPNCICDLPSHYYLYN